MRRLDVTIAVFTAECGEIGEIKYFTAKKLTFYFNSPVKIRENNFERFAVFNGEVLAANFFSPLMPRKQNFAL